MLFIVFKKNQKQKQQQACTFAVWCQHLKIYAHGYRLLTKIKIENAFFWPLPRLFGKKLMSRRFDVKCHLLCFIRCLQAKIDIFHTLYTSENLKTSMYGNTSCVRNLWSIVRSLCWIKHLKERCVLRQSKPNMRPKGQLGMWYLHVTLVNANYEELWNIRSSLEQKTRK